MDRISHREQARSVYGAVAGRKMLFLLALAPALGGMVLIDIMTGAAGLSMAQVIAATIRPETAERAAYVIVWQMRLPIARALLKDAPLLVLDEATASIDNANEAAIQEALSGLMRGRTVLIIAHRLSTIQSAGRIYVLDKGRLIETGAHDDLVGSKGIY